MNAFSNLSQFAVLEVRKGVCYMTARSCYEYVKSMKLPDGYSFYLWLLLKRTPLKIARGTCLGKEIVTGVYIQNPDRFQEEIDGCPTSMLEVIKCFFKEYVPHSGFEIGSVEIIRHPDAGEWDFPTRVLLKCTKREHLAVLDGDDMGTIVHCYPTSLE